MRQESSLLWLVEVSHSNINNGCLLTHSKKQYEADFKVWKKNGDKTIFGFEKTKKNHLISKKNRITYDPDL